MLLRRVLTITGLILASLFAIAMVPVTIALAIFLRFVPGFKSTPQMLAFFYGYLFYEWQGLARLIWVGVRYRPHSLLMDKTRDVQFWWAQSLLNLGMRLFRVTIEVSGQDALKGPCALLFSRHTSMGDTVLPLIYFGKARSEGLRYVLKQELQIVPCLDIGGHRIPNVFVDRSGADSAHAIRQIYDLVSSAGNDESVLIYPEGTRYTQTKHKELGQRHKGLADQLARWPNLLPPRLGGVTAMLEANPGKDVVFLAHSGFEGSANINDLFNGSWLNQRVKLHFWRVPYTDLPKDKYNEFIFSQWDQMQSTVIQLQADLKATA